MKLKNFKKKAEFTLRQTTLCFLVRDDEILLGMKKRGFGKGKWNGIGGKLNPSETIEQAAIREAKEEIGIIIKEKDLELKAIMDFYFPHSPEWSQQVTVYFTNNWIGNPVETEEMKPKWFKKNNLPFKKMWQDDIYWIPKVLQGKKVRAEFLFGKNDILLDRSVTEVELLNFQNSS